MVETLDTEARVRLAGSAVERKGWVLVALLAAVMVVFGFQAYFSAESPSTPIVGSLCCTGQRFSEAPGWTFDYAGELAKYMATYRVGTGVFALAVLVGGVRTGRRGAWYVAWVVPAIFAVHAFALGAMPFDLITCLIAVAGQLLMIRPVFGARSEA